MTVRIRTRTERGPGFVRSEGRDRMLFKDLVEVSKKVSVTTQKKEKTSLLAECLKRGQGEEIALARGFRPDKAIFEGETVAVQPDGRPLPFQTTMRRFGRVRDIERMKKEIPLTSFFFDLLYLGGEPLFDEPYRKRFELLSESVPSGYRIPQIVTADEEVVRDFPIKSLEAGHEGIMAKGVESPYVAGHRGFYWLKIKPAKTLDLVILAAE